MTSSTPAIDKAAERLWEAERSRQPCTPIRDLIPAQDIEAAYAIQQVNVQRHISAGRAVSGRKIGLTAKSVQDQFGVLEPDFGTLYADMEYGHGSTIPFDRLIHPRIEAEIMFVLGRDLDQETINVPDVIQATAFVTAALEVVDCRLRDWDIRISDTVSDNAAAGLYVPGSAPRALLGTDLANCSMTLYRNGVPVSSGRGEDSLGHPLNAVTWLARKLRQLGTPLRAGDVVLSGALGPMVEAHPGDRFEARIDGLGNAIVHFA
ncbi:2-keto-4-pentenoate hydratase [Streptomyces sp. NPDC059850]|uniref:2-keto-4-pentenoate hydratase n=1 Tax=Streptomyces sp. NPDC059850 TaxID=3346970 RepID=UPI00364E2812